VVLALLATQGMEDWRRELKIDFPTGLINLSKGLLAIYCIGRNLRWDKRPKYHPSFSQQAFYASFSPSCLSPVEGKRSQPSQVCNSQSVQHWNSPRRPAQPKTKKSTQIHLLHLLGYVQLSELD
jgi:hypothetical protein